MKYFAACSQIEEVAACTVFPPNRILLSYHYWKKKSKMVKDYINQGFEVFIDSGAFSADNSGVKVNLSAYMDFIREVNPKYYAVLDVIGNSKETMLNQKIMEEEGLTPVPVFHMGSTLEEFIPIMEKYDYICFGGLVMSPGIQNHCDLLWRTVLNNKPNLRVHGFGLTNLILMERYPWFSIDSSSYNACKRYGRQSILWNGFQFRTMQEEEFKKVMRLMHYDPDNMENKYRYQVYDIFSNYSYKLFIEHLTTLHEYKDFKYLSNQLTLF